MRDVPELLPLRERSEQPYTKVMQDLGLSLDKWLAPHPVKENFSAPPPIWVSAKNLRPHPTNIFPKSRPYTQMSGFWCCAHVSRKKYPVHKFITQTFTVSFNWGRLHPDKGHPWWNLYFELLLLSKPYCDALWCPTAEQKLPTMWAHPCSYHIKN